MPNQGSNLDFTDPESVVLPITPLGTEIGCKDTVFLNCATDFWIFFEIFYSVLVRLPPTVPSISMVPVKKNRLMSPLPLQSPSRSSIPSLSVPMML